MSKQEHDTKPPTRREVIHQIARELRGKSAIGRRAQLRRLNFRSPDNPEFWRIVVRHLDPFIDVDRYREADERRWAAILPGLAEIAGADLYHRGQSLGEAAALAGMLENRFIRLLRSRGDALLDLLRPLARQLLSKGVRVDWGDVADLVTSEGRTHEQDIRNQLAKHFFLTMHKKKTSS